MPESERVVRSYIGGSWVPPGSGTPVAVRNPADLREISGYVSWADVRQAVSAVESAGAALPAWRALPVAGRARYLRHLMRLLQESIHEIAATITAENGKTLRESRSEVEATIRDGLWHIDALSREQAALPPPSAPGAAACEVRGEPLGVVLLITPWNFPLATVGRKLIPAILLGNTAVVKPSEVTPLTAGSLFRLLHETGIPPGAANLVLGEGPEVGPALAGHDDVRAISFTGSSHVGLRICRQTAAQDTRLQMEMGGKNALVILADADLDDSAGAALAGAFSCAGQWCTGTSRVIVEEAVHDRILERLVRGAARIRIGDGRDPATDMGPVATAGQVERFEHAIQRAVSEGARIAAGGCKLGPVDGRPGHYVQPTVLSEVTPLMAVAREEVFTPVLAVMRARDAQDALAIANATGYGLSFSLYTSDESAAFRFLDGVDAGICHVNLPTYYREPHMPIGGRRDSGRGIPECGTYARDFFTRVKAVYRRIP